MQRNALSMNNVDATMARMSRSLFVAIFTLCSLALSQEQPTYMLRVEREQESSTGSQVDLITLRCRNTVSGNFELIRGGVIFWFNRATPDDPNIKNEPDVFSTGDGRGIVFQLSRQREGNYTCGMRIDEANVMESERETLIGELTSELIDNECDMSSVYVYNLNCTLYKLIQPCTTTTPMQRCRQHLEIYCSLL